jgi:hypothetical protein
VLTQQLQSQLGKQHSAEIINYITEKEKHKDNSHRAIMMIVVVVVVIMKQSGVTCTRHTAIHTDTPLTTHAHALG